MASRVFAKLNLKDRPEESSSSMRPRSFEAELDQLDGVPRVRRKLTPSTSVSFALVFVTTQAGIEAVARPLAKAAAADAIIWFAYPKGTSKNYRSTSRSRPRLERARRRRLRVGADDRHRRGLDREAPAQGGIHQDDEARCGLGDVEAGEGKGVEAARICQVEDLI